jgi:CubicO group peptidase (beta-lactamase class C family)
MARFGQIHRPGAEFSYCNAGVVIAGYLAQRLQKKSWYTLVKERIYQPLQMEHSVTLPEEALLYRVSVGHFMNPTTQQMMRTSNAFNPISRAPCGPTLMMSAQDLMSFARAHMRLGAGVNGARILSENAARAMQRVTVNNQGKGYASDLDLGLGWMISNNGLLQHSGGAPGVSAWLGVHPERDFAAAILMNSGNGRDLFNDLMEPRLAAAGFPNVVTTPELKLPTQPVKFDPARYVGEYESVVVRVRVAQAAEGLTLSFQQKFNTNADDSSLAPSPPVPLIALGDDKFVPRSPSGKNVTGEIVAFRNVRPDGKMEHLGNWTRLFKRHMA